MYVQRMVTNLRNEMGVGFIDDHNKKEVISCRIKQR